MRSAHRIDAIDKLNLCTPRQVTLLLLVFALLLSGCGQMRTGGVRPALSYHKVQPGETLYAIAWAYGYDHRQVAAWNRISPPYNIRVGETLLLIPPYQRDPKSTEGVLPPTASAAGTRVVSTVSSSPLNIPSSARTGSVSRPVPRVEPGVTVSPARLPSAADENLASATPPSRSPLSVPARPSAPVASPGAAPSSDELGPVRQWLWPLQGKVVENFDPSKGRKGIDILGNEGDPVHASAAGEVVYAGNSLFGYGNLLILKHNELFLSAYGHNRELLVKEGDKVKAGAAIAKAGRDTSGRPVLHFEIRYEGEPIDPMSKLP